MKTWELITSISGGRSFGFRIDSGAVPSQLGSDKDAVGVGPGDGRGSSHGSYKSALLIGIGGYALDGGGDERIESCKFLC